MGNRIGFFTAVLLLTGIAVFCMAKTVWGKENGEPLAVRAYYGEQEREYRRQMKEILEQYGMENGGITMTKTLEQDGRRSYLIQIHHKRAKKLSAEEKRRLVHSLKEAVFPMQDCVFFYNFI